MCFCKYKLLACNHVIKLEGFFYVDSYFNKASGIILSSFLDNESLQVLLSHVGSSTFLASVLYLC